MDWLLLLKALTLGIVEGLTEFIPVSSTGHLIIVGNLLHYDNEQSKVFEVFIQLGAILAVCWHYRVRLVMVIKGLCQRNLAARRFVVFLVIAFFPAAVMGLPLYGVIKSYLFNPLSVALALIVGGVLILIVERRPRPARITRIDDMCWQDALKIGMAQCAALCPGVSRSGATIIGGLMFGFSRQAATEFSFFLAIPTMFAATGYDLVKSWQMLSLGDFPVFLAGFVASFLFGLFAVKALLHFVSRHDFTGFAWYRIAFGCLVLISAAAGWVTWQV
jgi:undecaprenyl-diphosphatase